MNLSEILEYGVPEKVREIYLSIPFNPSSIVAFDSKEDFKFFLKVDELKIFKNIYLKHGISYNQMCKYLIYYVENNTRHNDDIIMDKLSFKVLLDNLDNYSEYDFIFTNGEPNKNSELFIIRVHPSHLVIPSDMVDFMEVDLVKHLSNMYKSENTEQQIEKILYFYNNLSYPDMESLTVAQLIENLENYYIEISVNISGYSEKAKAKLLWNPYYDGIIKDRAIAIENLLQENGWHDFNTIGILSDWKEDYIDFLKEEDIETTPILLSYLILHEHIWDAGPPDEWIEQLLSYLEQDCKGNTIPSDIFDR